MHRSLRGDSLPVIHLNYSPNEREEELKERRRLENENSVYLTHSDGSKAPVIYDILTSLERYKV